jgi:DNA-binding XRE family transcriptional regulator
LPSVKGGSRCLPSDPDLPGRRNLRAESHGADRWRGAVAVEAVGAWNVVSTRSPHSLHCVPTAEPDHGREVVDMVSLRTLRAERLLSIRELARRAAVAPSTIYLIEVGRTIPRQRVARQIAKVLRVDPMEVDELRRRIEATKMVHRSLGAGGVESPAPP